MNYLLVKCCLFFTPDMTASADIFMTSGDRMSVDGQESFFDSEHPERMCARSGPAAPVGTAGGVGLLSACLCSFAWTVFFLPSSSS